MPNHQSPSSALPALDDPLTEALVRSRRFFTKGTVSPDLRTLTKQGGRQADDFYRDRWSHDKVVRSTHGVNCTGSCSWKVYVKDGIITWETQQTDYPSVGPDRPEYEPRGCPRGASFSWYTYSPTRVRYPYVRGVLLADVPRGQGAARRRPGARVGAHRRGPAARDGATSRRAARAGWFAPPGTRPPRSSPPPTCTRSRRTAPTGSPASRRSRRCRWSRHASGARFVNLIGGVDADRSTTGTPTCRSPRRRSSATRPTCRSPGTGGTRRYLMMWGSNVPVTRTPDAHWMTEARYRGQKVVAVAPTTPTT